MTNTEPLDLDARLDEVESIPLPTRENLSDALEWLAEEEGMRPDWYAENTSIILLALKSVPALIAEVRRLRAGHTNDWEYGAGYEGDNGREVLWFALHSDGFTVREAAEHKLAEYFDDPQVKLIRRPKAGPWELAPIEETR